MDSHGSTTTAAALRAQAGADKRVKRLELLAEHDDPYLALQAIRLLLELALKSPQDLVEPATAWMPERKAKLVLRWLRQATQLRDSGAPKALRAVEPRVPFTGIPPAAQPEVVDAEVISSGEVRIPIEEDA